MNTFYALLTQQCSDCLHNLIDVAQWVFSHKKTEDGNVVALIAN